MKYLEFSVGRGVERLKVSDAAFSYLSGASGRRTRLEEHVSTGRTIAIEAAEEDAPPYVFNFGRVTWARVIERHGRGGFASAV